MVHYLLTIYFFFILAVGNVYAAEQALLRDLVKEETLGKTIMELTLSALPKFHLEFSGQRIDLFLANTTASSSLNQLPQDGSILKILLAQRGSELMVSFLLARPPTKATVVSEKSGTDLTLHIEWNPKTNKVRPAIAHSLRGKLVADGNGIKARVAARSKYAPHMKNFYRKFQTPIEWQIPIHYTLPEFPGPESKPATAGSPAAVLQEARQHSLANRWPEVLTLLNRLPVAEILPLDLPSFFMLYSAALIQSDDYDSARDLYRQFENSYPASPHLDSLKVLLAFGRARIGDPYGAANEIGDLVRLGNSTEKPTRILAELLFAEVQLTIDRPQLALEALRRIGSAGSPPFSRMVLLRIADAQAALGRYREAHAGYQYWLATLAADDSLSPYSLVQMAVTLEQQNKLQEAEKTYIKIAGRIQKPSTRALALFAAARVGMKRGETDKVKWRCAVIRKDYPGTEGAFRAWLMELDLVMAENNKAWILGRGHEYAAIAATTPSRVLREEAAFKNALTFVLAGQTRQGLALLLKFRRDFAVSDLQSEAEILTLELLDPLVKKLMGEGKALDALALIEQNRDLLVSSALPPGLAVTVAGAFRELGLLYRSSSIYQHLLNDAEGTAAAEQFYLPLVETLYADGHYQKILSMVRRYQQQFPTGPSLPQLLLNQGRALLALERLDEVAVLLDTLQMSPEVVDLRNQLLVALAVRDGANSPSLGKMLFASAPDKSPETQLMRAERLLRGGQTDLALAIFQRMIAADIFADLARYRSGQICLERGERQRGVNFLQYLVDKGKDPHWQSLARETLALAGVKYSCFIDIESRERSDASNWLV